MRSISTRLTVWYALASTVTGLIIFVFGRYLLEESYIDGIDQLNESEWEEVRPRILDPEAQRSPEAAARAIRGHTEIDASLFFFQVGHADHEVFFASSNLAGHRFPEEVRQSDRITVDDRELGLLRVATYQAGRYEVLIASSLQGWQTLNARLLRLGLAILVIVFLASLALGYGLSRLALRPIAGIRLAASRINADNLSERIVEPAGGDEIAGLVHLLNRMFDRLEAAFQQAQRFTADASHELKTPLSLIRLNAEALLNQDRISDEDRRKLVEAQIEEIERLNRMINDLLVLAKADVGALPMKFEATDVSSFIRDFAEDARVLCEEKDIRFELENRSDVLATVDRVWVRHCLFNLLANALKFSPKGGMVSLRSVDDGTVWMLAIADEGPGVAPGKLERIFDRFFREGEDTPDHKGSGLGLALCRSIAARHEGMVAAANRTDSSGLIVELRFPLRRVEAVP